MEANNKVMREALEDARNYLLKHCGSSEAQAIVRRIEHTLSAPPRNCDRFDGETEAMIAFLNEKWLVGVADLKEYPFCEWLPVMKTRYAKWLMEKENDFTQI